MSCQIDETVLFSTFTTFKRFYNDNCALCPYKDGCGTVQKSIEYIADAARGFRKIEYCPSNKQYHVFMALYEYSIKCFQEETKNMTCMDEAL